MVDDDEVGVGGVVGVAVAVLEDVLEDAMPTLTVAVYPAATLPTGLRTRRDAMALLMPV